MGFIDRLRKVFGSQMPENTTVYEEVEDTHEPETKEVVITDNDFYIFLTIEGTEYEDVSIKVSDPTNTIECLTEKIVKVFELEKKDPGGNCIQYLLGITPEGDDETEVFEFEDDEGNEMTLLDYNVFSGDHLTLISVPIAAYACPIPKQMEEEWKKISYLYWSEAD